MVKHYCFKNDLGDMARRLPLRACLPYGICVRGRDREWLPHRRLAANTSAAREAREGFRLALADGSFMDKPFRPNRIP